MSDEQNTDAREKALDELAKAMTPSELIAAHRHLGRLARRRQKTERRELGPLASAWGEASRIWDAQKAEGIPREERLAGFEQVLRDLWPRGREKSWVYLCDTCRDTGWELFECRFGQRCNGISTRTDDPFQKPGRYRRLCTMSDTYTHEYVDYCSCARGQWLRPKPKYDGDEDIARIGRRKKSSSSFSRFND